MSGLEIPLCLGWTVDTRNKPDFAHPVRSSNLRCRGGEWSLSYRYCYIWGHHVLGLQKVSDVPPDPFDVSVIVEGVGTDRIATELSQKTRCTSTGQEEGKVRQWDIWVRSNSYVERSDPELNRDSQLRFLVVIRGGDAPLTEFMSTTAQIKDLKEYCPTTSTSVLTALLPSSCLENLSDDLSKYMDRGSDSDVEFRCGEQSIAAHAAIVCARSPVIACMLRSEMVEGSTRVVQIPDMRPDVFRHFLRYLYSGTLPELTTELALKLYEGGLQYAVSGLARRCSRYLLEHLTVQNACEVLVTADDHRDADLRGAVVEFMVQKKVPRVSNNWPKFCSSHSTLAVEVLNRICNAVAE